jgi:hypothetical protein
MSLQGSWHVGSGNSILGAGTVTAVAYSASTIGTTGVNTNIILREMVLLPSMVMAIGFTVTTAVTTTAPLLTFTVQPTFGSATGARTLGTVTVPVSAVGSVVINYLLGAESGQLVDPGEDNPVYVNPGEEIICTLTTKGTGTGDGVAWAAKRHHQIGAITAQTITKPYGATTAGNVYIVTA